MKTSKMLLGLGSVAMVASPIAAVISCSSSNSNEGTTPKVENPDKTGNLKPNRQITEDIVPIENWPDLKENGLLGADESTVAWFLTSIKDGTLITFDNLSRIVEEFGGASYSGISGLVRAILSDEILAEPKKSIMETLVNLNVSETTRILKSLTQFDIHNLDSNVLKSVINVLVPFLDDDAAKNIEKNSDKIINTFKLITNSGLSNVTKGDMNSLISSLSGSNIISSILSQIVFDGVKDISDNDAKQSLKNLNSLNPGKNIDKYYGLLDTMFEAMGVDWAKIGVVGDKSKGSEIYKMVPNLLSFKYSQDIATKLDDRASSEFQKIKDVKIEFYNLMVENFFSDISDSMFEDMKAIRFIPANDKSGNVSSFSADENIINYKSQIETYATGLADKEYTEDELKTLNQKLKVLKAAVTSSRLLKSINEKYKNDALFNNKEMYQSALFSKGLKSMSKAEIIETLKIVQRFVAGIAFEATKISDVKNVGELNVLTELMNEKMFASILELDMDLVGEVLNTILKDGLDLKNMNKNAVKHIIKVFVPNLDIDNDWMDTMVLILTTGLKREKSNISKINIILRPILKLFLDDESQIDIVEGTNLIARLLFGKSVVPD